MNMPDRTSGATGPEHTPGSDDPPTPQQASPDAVAAELRAQEDVATPVAAVVADDPSQPETDEIPVVPAPVRKKASAAQAAPTDDGGDTSSASDVPDAGQPVAEEPVADRSVAAEVTVDSSTADPPAGATTTEATVPTPLSAWARLVSACKPRMTRAQILAAVLCAVLGFALAVQLTQNQEDEFSGLRQSDLVRILDDVSRRSDSLEREATALRETEFELRSGSDSQQAAIELAEKNAAIQGILSGRLPAEGPGLEITIVEGVNRISAARLFNVLEELRNAGAEAIEVNGIRMVTSSYFQDTPQGMLIDGISVSPPYRWTAIGDPQTLEPAISIPGGAMATITTNGGRATSQQKDLVQIRSVRDPADPQYATPVPTEG